MDSDLRPLDQLQRVVVRDYNIELMKTQIAKGQDVRSIGFRGFTCLHEAAAYPESKKCLLFILHLAKSIINQKSYEGCTPLLIACVNNNLVGAEILLKAGCDPNIPDNEGATPLHYVCADGNETIAKLLISFGALLDVQNCKKNTPLHETVMNSSLEICQLLVKAGANVSVKERYGKMPFNLACDRGQFQLVSFLLSYQSDINSRDCNEMTGLMAATRISCYEIVKLLIDHGADPNLPDDELILPIQQAAYTYNPKLMKLLIDCTRIDMIEKFCSYDCLNDFNRTKSCLRSLSCIALDFYSSQTLKVILDADLSQKVKACPFIDINSICIPPISMCLTKVVNDEMDPSFFYLFLKADYDINYFWYGPQAVLTPLSAVLANGTVENEPRILMFIQDLLDAGAEVDYLSNCFELVKHCDCPYCVLPASDKLPDVFKFAVACKNINVILTLLKRSCVVEPHLLLEFLFECCFRLRQSFINLVEADYIVVALLKLSPCFKVQRIFYPEAWQIKTVPSLSSICRDVIRNQIHEDTKKEPKLFFTEINQLKIPLLLKNYLKFLT